MKIKSLLLLGLLAIGSMNAFADNFKTGGLVFTLTPAVAPATVGTATVDGVRKDYVKAGANVAIEIPATVTDGDGKLFNVTGFTTATWFSTVSTTTDFETMDVTSLLEKITYDITNFTAVPQNYAITGLKEIVIKGTSTINGDITFPTYNPGTKLVTLDMSGAAPKAGKKLTVAGFAGSLKTVKLPGADIADNAFNANTTIEKVLGAGKIGASAFAGATKLNEITFNGKEIGANAFNGCAALTAVDLSNVEKVGSSAFLGTKITTANLAKAKTIGADAFKGVAQLTSITLKSDASIGANAFDGTGAAELIIPKDATVGANAFANMTKLTTLTIQLANVPAAFTGDTKVTTLNLEGVETIASGAFADMPITKIDLSKCPNLSNVSGRFKSGVALSKVKLGGSQVTVSQIDLSASANSLKSITLSATETWIPSSKFQGFTKLTSIILPETVTSIGNNAFDGSGLTEITIPAGCYVNPSAFANCAALATATFEYVDGNITTISNNAFEATALEAVSLPANVTSIGYQAFKDCAVLKTFIADALTAIPAAFEGCDKLKAVIIPKTVQTIAPKAFQNLAKLAAVTFKHEGADDSESAVLAFIGANAFEGTAITSIDLSKTQLTSLNNKEVFKGCTALATVTLPEEMDDLQGKSIFEGTAIETLDASMVDGTVNNIFGSSKTAPNNALKVLKLGDATINTQAFEYCTKLKTLVAGAATIKSSAFGNCEKLATVTVLPYNEETGASASINANAFDHCSALTTFNFTCDWQDYSDWGGLSTQAFTYCTPYITINTTKEFASYYGNAPLNATWTAEALNCVITTVQDKANANQFVAKFWDPANIVVFNSEDVKLYSVYVDGETAYFQACRPDGGLYYVYPGDHVILKTTEAKEVTYEVDNWGGGKTAVAFDDIQSLPFDGELGDIQTALGMGSGDYLYRLTNTEGLGFGFTAYTGTTIKANQFFISTTKKPESARLNIVWLDEDGNVEDVNNAATAIQSVKIDANDGEIYNMQGVRVDKPTKGLYIQNGKKIVVK